MSDDRIPCSCPGCRRTVCACSLPDGNTEWICGPHWGAVPRRMRNTYTRVKRRWRAGRADVSAVDRIWARCKRAAIDEALMGVHP